MPGEECVRNLETDQQASEACRAATGKHQPPLDPLVPHAGCLPRKSERSAVSPENLSEALARSDSDEEAGAKELGTEAGLKRMAALLGHPRSSDDAYSEGEAAADDGGSSESSSDDDRGDPSEEQNGELDDDNGSDWTVSECSSEPGGRARGRKGHPAVNGGNTAVSAKLVMHPAPAALPAGRARDGAAVAAQPAAAAAAKGGRGGMTSSGVGTSRLPYDDGVKEGKRRRHRNIARHQGTDPAKCPLCNERPRHTTQSVQNYYCLPCANAFSRARRLGIMHISYIQEQLEKGIAVEDICRKVHKKKGICLVCSQPMQEMLHHMWRCNPCRLITARAGSAGVKGPTAWVREHFQAGRSHEWIKDAIREHGAQSTGLQAPARGMRKRSTSTEAAQLQGPHSSRLGTQCPCGHDPESGTLRTKRKLPEVKAVGPGYAHGAPMGTDASSNTAAVAPAPGSHAALPHACKAACASRSKGVDDNRFREAEPARKCLANEARAATLVAPLGSAVTRAVVSPSEQQNATDQEAPAADAASEPQPFWVPPKRRRSVMPAGTGASSDAQPFWQPKRGSMPTSPSQPRGPAPAPQKSHDGSAAEASGTTISAPLPTTPMSTAAPARVDTEGAKRASAGAAQGSGLVAAASEAAHAAAPSGSGRVASPQDAHHVANGVQATMTGLPRAKPKPSPPTPLCCVCLVRPKGYPRTLLKRSEGSYCRECHNASTRARKLGLGYDHIRAQLAAGVHIDDIARRTKRKV